jgi:hypothetical protein
MAGLLLGLWGGLVRIGWPLPAADLAWVHGPLLVSGFFGLVVSLERAVALRRPVALAGPAAAALGAALMVAGAPPALGALAWAAAAAGLLAMSAAILHRQPALFTATPLLGALAWLVGNLLWIAGSGVPAVVAWWVLFLVLTIAAERLEMSRVLRPAGRSAWPFAAALVPLVAGAGLGLAGRAGSLLLGIGLLALAAWLLRHDVARRTVRSRGLPRFAAVALLSGYAWLVVAGAIALAGPVGASPYAYDAFLHAVLVGFVFAMVFGHAPIILPAVAGVPVPFRAVLYAPLALLHAALALRLAADAAAWFEGRRLGGLAAAVAIFLFAGTVAALGTAARRGRSA